MNVVAPEVLMRLERLHASIVRVIRGKDEIVDALVAALIARGHVLLEDVPGVGKTTLAQALARSLQLEFHRIQFTSDTLPSDILGISVFRQDRGVFEFVPGPLFANVVLADEINSRSRRTDMLCRTRFWWWPPRTPWSPPAPIRCPSRSSTGS